MSIILITPQIHLHKITGTFIVFINKITGTCDDSSYKTTTIEIPVNYPPLSRVYDFSKYRILVFENASLQISDCLRILWCGFIAFCES